MNAALAKVLLILLVLHSCTTGMRFTVTLDALRHGGTPLEIGLMLSTVALFPAFLAVKAGRWLDDKGPKGPLFLSIACTLFAGVETLLLPVDRAGLAPLFAACLSVGFGFLLVNTVTQRLVGDVVRPEFRSNAFTFLSMTTAASGLVTPVFAGHLIEAFGFSSFYLWCSVLPVLLFLLLLTPWFRALLRPLRKRRAASAARGKASELLGDKALRAVLIASVLVSVGWEVGNLLIPVYCTSVKLSPSDIGWVLGSFSTASFVVRLLTPFLLRVLREWYMIALTFFLSATAFALFPLFENFWLLTATSFLLGLGLGAALPNMMSLVYRLSPPGRIGEAIGLRLMMMNMSKATFPVAMGALGSVIGAGSSLLGLGILLYGGFAYVLASAKAVIGGCDEAARRESERHD